MHPARPNSGPQQPVFPGRQAIAGPHPGFPVQNYTGAMVSRDANRQSAQQPTHHISLPESNGVRYVRVYPDPKRMRLDGEIEYVPIQSASGSQPTRMIVASPYRDDFIVPLGNRQNSMGRNSNAFHPISRTQPVSEGGSQKTTLAHKTISSPTSQNQSTESIIMNMNWLSKLRLFSRISLPAASRSDHGSTSRRGCFIVIEGEDESAVASVLSWLDAHLQREPGILTRVAGGPRSPAPNSKATLSQYLSIVSEWHNLSKAISDFVATARFDDGQVPQDLPAQRDDKMIEEELISPKNKIYPNLSAQSNSNRCHIPVSSTDRPPPPPPLTPVLLLSHYQYRTTNAWSCSIPIEDNYSPQDHWQWLATMWRGIVSADLTIFIKDYTAEELEQEKGRLVEVKEDMKCIILKRNRNNGTLEESLLRRLAFEVIEIVKMTQQREKGDEKDRGGREQKRKGSTLEKVE